MNAWQLAIIAGAVGAVAGIGIERLSAWALTLGDQGDDEPLPPRLWLTVAACAVVSGGIALLAGPVPTLPAWWAYGLLGVAISRTDIARHRIPDVLALGLLGIGAALLYVASVQQASSDAYMRAWLAAAATFVVFLLLALAGRTGLGMGDVKLAPALGLYLGYYGWTEVILGLFAGFVFGAVVGLGFVIAARARGGRVADALRRAIPFGPFLLVGGLLPLIAS